MCRKMRACKHLFTKIYLNMHVNAAESAFGRRHMFMQAEKDNERQNEEFKKRRRGIKKCPGVARDFVEG